MKKQVIALIVLSVGFVPLFASGADFYVDSQAAPGGIGTQASPFATIPAALAAASANSTIWVRGGEGRAYGVTNSTDTLQIPPGMDGLSICAYETTPGDGGRADVILSDTYIGSDTYVADKARFHIISNAANFVTVSGLAFSFGPNSVGKQYSKVNNGKDVVVGCSVFRNDGAFATLENCVFRMSKPTGFGGSGSTAAAPLVWCKTTDATNLVVRGCEFYNTRCWSVGHGYAPIQCMSNAQIVDNVFSNVNSVVVPEQHDWRQPSVNVSSENILIASNIVYGANEHNVSDNYPGILRGVYAGPSSVEIAYNRFIFDRNARAQNGNALQHRIWMSLGGQFGSALPGGDASLIHHNTFVGGIAAFLLKDAQGNKRKNKFFNNLILLDPGSTNLIENVKSGTTAFSGGRTTSFIAPSCLRNNAYTGVLTGGNATELETYDLEAGLEITNNIVISAPLEFICTNDIYNADFYRVRCHQGDPDLKKLGWRGPDGLQPRFIGALEPIVPGSFTIYLR
jgi:hypothetical protein